MADRVTADDVFRATWYPPKERLVHFGFFLFSERRCVPFPELEQLAGQTRRRIAYRAFRITRGDQVETIEYGPARDEYFAAAAKAAELLNAQRVVQPPKKSGRRK